MFSLSPQLPDPHILSIIFIVSTSSRCVVRGVGSIMPNSVSQLSVATGVMKLNARELNCHEVLVVTLPLREYQKKLFQKSCYTKSIKCVLTNKKVMKSHR